ncbi:hypothetical protein HB976_03120 [Yersinia mollaretii]|uniref:Lipoprotein n=1 Tax=Yersinia mollaretii TaxID=33060 RepID=A0AA36PMM9_YERMO|nr:hypothetical protein [Yersinia mollaretii]MDA5534024.1 hypothetical protein [Yersinia mollaretii]NIL01955.1 hypothetical protein [Yersinia mollaretii]CNH43858.1 Uncharacterised protein [Yersinia mollaretii]
MLKNTGKLYKFTILILCISFISSCTTKNRQRVLVYQINDNYFPLEKNCVERVYLREDKPMFYLNDNIIIELDNKKGCVQKFSKFINANIGKQMHISFNGNDIIPATKIVSEMNFDRGIFSQAVSKKEVALEIVKAYAN